MKIAVVDLEYGSFSHYLNKEGADVELYDMLEQEIRDLTLVVHQEL